MAVKRRTCRGACGRNRAEKFFKSPRARVCMPCQRKTAADNARDRRLQETYGISLDDYERLLSSQNGACAICGRTPRYNLDVDHDHALERALIERGVAPLMAKRMSVRGLLDKPCNRRLLPAARDDAQTLICAAGYVRRPPAHQLIGRLPHVS